MLAAGFTLVIALSPAAAQSQEQGEELTEEQALELAEAQAEQQTLEEAERQVLEEAEQRALEAAEQQALEEAEQQAREEAEQQTLEEAEQQALEEAEQQALEQAKALANTRSFSVEQGSLRANVRRLAINWGWELVAWDSTVQRDTRVIDWRIWADYEIRAVSIDDALEQLIGAYGLHARLHEMDRTLAIYLPQQAPPLPADISDENGN